MVIERKPCLNPKGEKEPIELNARLFIDLTYCSNKIKNFTKITEKMLFIARKKKKEFLAKEKNNFTKSVIR